MMFAVFSFWLWQETQYCVTSARAGVAGGAGAWNPETIQAMHTDANRTFGIVIRLLTATLILGLAGMPELRIGSVFQQQIRAVFIKQNAA